MKVKMVNGKPIFEGIEEYQGWEVFFHGILHCRHYIVFGQRPKEGFELTHAIVATGRENEEMEIEKIRHGHLYEKERGGYVECSACDILSWAPRGISKYDSIVFDNKEVFVA